MVVHFYKEGFLLKDIPTTICSILTKILRKGIIFLMKEQASKMVKENLKGLKILLSKSTVAIFIIPGAKHPRNVYQK